MSEIESDISNDIVSYDNIKYLLDEDENTADIIGLQDHPDEIIIPRSIKHKSKEYNITSILGNSFSFLNIKSIQFATDSKLQTIYGNAFRESAIESITIPSELIDLQEGWCNCTPKLTKIAVSTDNPRFCLYENKMIIGKTNIDQNYYDCLVFCVRDVEKIKIPNFIEHIYSYSFDNCVQLEEIEISNDSKLKSIGKNAFIQTKIKSLSIPSELIDLQEGWCDCMPELTKIIVSPNNQRYCCLNDKMIIGKSSIDQNYYDCLLFCVRDVQSIKIPNFIEHICSSSFCECKKLHHIEIPKDSKLQTINENAFYFTNINSITIPSSVTIIKEGAFDYCCQLRSVEIASDSKLQKIDKFAFYFTGIRKFRIPKSVTFIGECAFSGCQNLQKVEIPNDSVLQTIDVEGFSESGIESIIIPSSVFVIGEGAFNGCNNLHIVVISNIQMLSNYQDVFCYYEDLLIMVSIV